MPHFLASRIESLPILVLVTYRDDLERAHPMRILLGELPMGQSIARMRLEPLSREAGTQHGQQPPAFAGCPHRRRAQANPQCPYSVGLLCARSRTRSYGRSKLGGCMRLTHAVESSRGGKRRI